MQWIELDSWNRKRHFEMFKDMDFPHYNLSAEVEVSNALAFCKSHKLSSFVFMLYLITRTANQIENFRYRIREGAVCLHDKVNPSFTVLDEEDLYYHCSVEFLKDLSKFNEHCTKQISISKANKTLLDTVGRDDLLYMSCLPWIKYTSASHAMHLSPVDSVPRFYWGKYEKQMEQVSMPFSCQVHHALVDGVHVGKFFQLFQQYLLNPEILFD